MTRPACPECGDERIKTLVRSTEMHDDWGNQTVLLCYNCEYRWSE